MQTDKQKWVEGILSSVDGAKKVSSMNLTDRVMARVTRPDLSRSAWVDEVMNSTDGMARAAAPDISDAVLSGIGPSKRYTIAPADDNALIWRIAASVVFLLLLNGAALYRYQSHISRAENNHEIRAAASELGMGPASSDPGTVIFGN